MVSTLAIVLAVATAQPTRTAIVKLVTPEQHARQQALARWDQTEWRCLIELWHRESHWNPKANNPNSSAYGIPQILGLDPDLTPLQQIDVGLRYIQHRYETPCRALKHHKRHGWY